MSLAAIEIARVIHARESMADCGGGGSIGGGDRDLVLVVTDDNGDEIEEINLLDGNRRAVMLATTKARKTTMAESRTPAGGVAPQFTVRRDGDAPLKFCGAILAEGDSAQRNGQDSTRWHEATIYQTAGGKYVVAIAFQTRWKGESDVEQAAVCDSPMGVILALREYDPVPGGIGFPPRDEFKAKQQRLLADLRGRWGALVSALLGECGFSERVE